MPPREGRRRRSEDKTRINWERRRALPLPCFARAFSVDDSCRDLAIVTRSFTYSLCIGIVLKLTRGRHRGRLLNSMGLVAAGVITNIYPYVCYVRCDEAWQIPRTYLKKGAIEFNESTV